MSPVSVPPGMTYFPNEKVKVMGGSTNWVYWSLWDPSILEILPETINEDGHIMMTTHHFNDFFDATIKNLNYSFRGLQENPIVAYVTQMEYPTVPTANKVLIADPAFMYSRYSNRIEINVVIIQFGTSPRSSPEGKGWKQECTSVASASAAPTPPPSPVSAVMTACGGLAQLLTRKVQVNDFFIISGGKVELFEYKGRIELHLNEWIDDSELVEEDEDNRGCLDFIHLGLKVNEGLGEIHLLEKIKPIFVEKQVYEFTYSSFKNTAGKNPYFKQVVLLRHFFLRDNKEIERSAQLKRHEPFRVPIGRESKDVNRVYMAMTCKTLSLLDYENRRIEKQLKIKLEAKRSRQKVFNGIFISGIILIICVISAMDPGFWKKVSQFFDLSDKQ